MAELLKNCHNCVKCCLVLDCVFFTALLSFEEYCYYDLFQ